MNCVINTSNDILRNLSEDERRQLKDGIDFVYTNILLKSANTVLGKNINYNRDIIKTLSINGVTYYIHPILSKRGISPVFKVSIQVTRKTVIDQPFIYFIGEYDNILNFDEEIEQLKNRIQNPKSVNPDTPKEDGKPVEPEPQPEETKGEQKEEPTETTHESSTDDSSDDSEGEKTELDSAQTPLAAPFKPILHNVGVEFPSDKKAEKKTKRHGFFWSKKKKSGKKNKK